ncbi:glycosyltransferase [archaeon]|nr:glycosyltransferase [archaeon]
MPKKNILMIGWGWPPKMDGGLDTHIHNLTLNLSAKDDMKIDLFLPKINMPKTTQKGNLKIHPVNIKIQCNTIDSLIATVKRYNRKISKTAQRPDIIHVHDWLGIDAGIALKEQLKIPLILTVHSLEYMRSADESSNSEGIIDNIEKKGMAKADIIISVSDFMKKEIIRKYNIYEDKIIVIPNGPTFKNLGKPSKREKNLVVYCGRLTSQKGVEYLLLAAKEVLKKNKKTKFVIIGKGYLEKQLKDLASLLGIDDNVKFIGFTKTENIRDYYMKAEAVVFPSVFEPFGITVLDALSCGAPVITTENAGIAEDLKDRKHLLKVRERDSKDLAEAMISLLDTPSLRKTLSENGKKASEKYSWKNIASRTRDIYINLL